MSRLLRSLCVVAAGFLLVAETAAAQDRVPLRVMTFNIRFNNPADGLDAWPHRQEGLAGLIRFHDPDLVGLQEAQRNQLEDLQRLLPGYAWFGVPRADGGPRDEYSAVLYRRDRLELIAHSTFWLSETPDVAGSRGWDAQFPRIATWGRFRDRATGDTLLHLNTHFDHVGTRARAESARLLKQRLADLAGTQPTVVTGDFNTPPESEPIRVLTEASTVLRLRDALTVSAEPPYGPNSTWNGFRQIEPGRRIDYIFVGEGVRVLEHGILAETLPSGRFPSDHLPVIAEVVVQPRPAIR